MHIPEALTSPDLGPRNPQAEGTMLATGALIGFAAIPPAQSTFLDLNGLCDNQPDVAADY